MWWLSFVLHDASFGLLSVFIPLYIVALGGSLTQIGLMSSAAIFLSIPASFLWGYLCDKSRRYKPYILLSFFSLAILLYTFTLTTDIYSLIILYAIMAFFHMAHEPPKNVLIAESYTRRFWEKTYAFYEGITKVGWIIGIFIGFYMSVQGFITARTLLIVCSILNFVAFALSIFFIKDPSFIFERSLVKVERSLLCAYKGLIIAFKATNGVGYIEVGTKNLIRRFCLGLIAFFMATKMLFTPLPVFFSRPALHQSTIYALFCINTIGSLIGYLLLLKLHPGVESLYKVSGLRCALAFSLMTVEYIYSYCAVISASILFLFGFTYAIFHTLSLSISMELLSENMAGVFNVVTGLGEAFGSLIGPIMAEKFGFTSLFFTTGLIFLMACVILKRTTKLY